MVDDESGGVPEAFRSEARVVAVAGHDEDIDAVGDRANHLAFDTTAPAHQLGVRMSEANPAAASNSDASSSATSS